MRATARLLGLDAGTFERIAALREGDAAMDEDEANELFASYMEQIERVIAAVDRVEVASAR